MGALTPIKVLGLALMVTVSACKRNQTASSVKGADCGGNWLANFIGAIPLPGFAALGGVVKTAASTTAGALKTGASDASKGLCSDAAGFSAKQMKEMKDAMKAVVSEEIDSAEHRSAKALMNDLDTGLNRYAIEEGPDKADRLVDRSISWVNVYNQSRTKIYNATDFVIVGGYSLRAHQLIIIAQAIKARKSGDAGQAQLVKHYAANLQKEVASLRSRSEELANEAEKSLPRTYYSNPDTYNSESQGRVQCFLSKEGRSYYANDFPIDRRIQDLSNAINNAKNLKELSDYISKHGSLCCTPYSCGENYTGGTREHLNTKRDTLFQRIGARTRAMVVDSSGLGKFYGETLPIFESAAGKIASMTDEEIFALTDPNAAEGSASDSGSGGGNNASVGGSGSADNGKPYCQNNGGAGYGDPFDCGNGYKCAKDDGSSYSDSSICVIGGGGGGDYSGGGGGGGGGGGSAGNGKPYCQNNGGAGYGQQFDCGGGFQCAKDDGSSYSDSSICVVGGGGGGGGGGGYSGGGGGGTASNGKPYCNNNGGQGFGDPFDCGDGLQCRKDDGSSYSDSSICVSR